MPAPHSRERAVRDRHSASAAPTPAPRSRASRPPVGRHARGRARVGRGPVPSPRVGSPPAGAGAGPHGSSHSVSAAARRGPVVPRGRKRLGQAVPASSGRGGGWSRRSGLARIKLPACRGRYSIGSPSRAGVAATPRRRPTEPHSVAQQRAHVLLQFAHQSPALVFGSIAAPPMADRSTRTRSRPRAHGAALGLLRSTRRLSPARAAGLVAASSIARKPGGSRQRLGLRCALPPSRTGQRPRYAAGMLAAELLDEPDISPVSAR